MTIVNITAKGPVSKSVNLSSQRQLPVCYSLDEFVTSDSDVIGGFVLRGIPKDPLASLREEFEQGKASNSTLVTLIIHDLKNGSIEKARLYYDTLQQRVPESKIVKVLSEKFQMRK
jgi:hypothetical protein